MFHTIKRYGLLINLLLHINGRLDLEQFLEVIDDLNCYCHFIEHIIDLNSIVRYRFVQLLPLNLEVTLTPLSFFELGFELVFDTLSIFLHLIL